MEYYHEREEDNLDYDPLLHFCGSNPGGSLSYVNSATGDFCRGPESDNEDDFDSEMSYEMYSEDCSSQQNLESKEEEVEDDSFYLNGICLASQRNEQPASVGTKEAETEIDKDMESEVDEDMRSEGDEETDSEVDEEADSEVDEDADSEVDEEADSEDDTECIGTGSPCDPQYLDKMRSVNEDEEDDYFESHRSLDEELDEQILSFLEDEDEESGGFTCYICGEKPKNMRRHYNIKHKGPCPCGFCGKVMEFNSIHAHIRDYHRAETGLFAPPPKMDGAQPLEPVNLEAELDKMRGNRDWRIIQKTGYCCMYDETRHTPIAVMQRLTKASLVKKLRSKAEADKQFYAAKELKKNVDPNSFKNEGNVIGHLAARADCVSSESAFKDSHSMLNATPQNPRVNGGVVLLIEKHSRVLVYIWDDVIIITGPIFDDDAKTVESINGVDYPIPTAFFKILILRREGEPSRIMSFIISNKFENSHLYNRKATLKQISEQTGLDLSAYQHLQYTWDLDAPIFRCPGFRCHHTFKTEAELKEHLNDHHWKCHKCGKVFPESEKTQHLATHRVHVCQYCNAGFMSKGDVIIHERTHTGAKPYVCTDPACNGKCFRQKAQLNRHNKMKHSDEEKPYHCEVVGCGKKFALKQYLTEHIRTHTGEKPFVCSVCGVGFSQSSGLNDHIRSVHKKDYEKDPSESGLGPSDSVSCSSENAASGKRKIEGKSDEAPVPAKQMRLESEGKGVSISDSGPSTSKLDGTTVTVKAVTASASTTGMLPFKCSIKKCGRRFLTKEELIEHRRIFHATTHPYRCEEHGCELTAFRHKYELDKHTDVVHRKVTDYQAACQICGKVLSSKACLKRHVRDTHPASDSTSDSAAPASKKPPGNAATAPQKKARVTATSTAGPSVSERKVRLAPIFVKPVSAPKRIEPTTNSEPELITLD